MARNIIGNRIFGGNSIAFVSLKISRWFRDSSRLPKNKSGWNKTSWKRVRRMNRFNGQGRRRKVRNNSRNVMNRISNVIRDKNRQLLRKIIEMFFKNRGINMSKGI